MKNSEKNPLISIIVPVYNGEKYIKECIESILNQTYKNIELILVDDGGSDNSVNILEEYAKNDERIVVLHEENSGVSTARNNALKIMTGDYVTFVDQDDCISKDYLEYFLKLALDNESEISMTPRAYRFKDEVPTLSCDEDDEIKVISGDAAAKEMFYYNITIGPWNKLISTKLIKEDNLCFNKEFFGGEGFSFSVDCFQRAKKVAVGKRKLYLYRVDNPNSGTTKFSYKMIISNIESQKYMKENLVRKTPELLRACRYSNWHSYCDSFNTMVGCKVINKYKDTYKKLKKVCRWDALVSLNSPIPIKEKLKGIAYFISPYITARVINHFRMRKFTVEKKENINE